MHLNDKKTKRHDQTTCRIQKKHSRMLINAVRVYMNERDLSLKDFTRLLIEKEGLDAQDKRVFTNTRNKISAFLNKGEFTSKTIDLLFDVLDISEIRVF